MSSDRYKSLFFEDVAEGDELPTLSMTVTLEKALMGLAAARDWNPIHYDREYCQKQAKKPDLFVGTWFYMGMLTRFATDWAGPMVTVSKLRYSMRDSISPGHEMKIEGRVAARRIEDQRHLVDLEFCVSNQFGPTTPGTMTVELPSKG